MGCCNSLGVGVARITVHRIDTGWSVVTSAPPSMTPMLKRPQRHYAKHYGGRTAALGDLCGWACPTSAEIHDLTTVVVGLRWVFSLFFLFSFPFQRSGVKGGGQGGCARPILTRVLTRRPRRFDCQPEETSELHLQMASSASMPAASSSSSSSSSASSASSRPTPTTSFRLLTCSSFSLSLFLPPSSSSSSSSPVLLRRWRRRRQAKTGAALCACASAPLPFRLENQFPLLRDSLGAGCLDDASPPSNQHPVSIFHGNLCHADGSMGRDARQDSRMGASIHQIPLEKLRILGDGPASSSHPIKNKSSMQNYINFFLFHFTTVETSQMNMNVNK